VIRIALFAFILAACLSQCGSAPAQTASVDRWLTPASTAAHLSASIADVQSSSGMRQRGTCESNPLFRGPDCTALIGRMATVQIGLIAVTATSKWALLRRAKTRTGTDRVALLWLVRGLNILDVGLAGLQWKQAGDNWQLHRQLGK
jgi:hypothetical protein